jgi:hypothetical protein
VIHGFLESEHVFHADTGLSLEFSVFPSFLSARVIGTNVHLRHPKESKVYLSSQKVSVPISPDTIFHFEYAVSNSRGHVHKNRTASN